MLSVTMAGLNAAQKSMDVTSNNMSNASTVGFKRSTATFGDVFSNDPASNPKTSVGSGVLTSSVSRDTTAGALKTTGRVTDMAIDGRGFFVVRDPSATGDTFSFTRAGNFSIDAQGFLVDPSGNQLIGFNSSDSGKLDANGKPIMQPDLAAAKSAVQVKPQYTNGQTLPDGTLAGQEVQLVSLKGPATATGSINVGGVSVDINLGDSVSQMAAKVQSALSSNSAYANRQVSVVGTGDASQVKIVFAAAEGAVAPISVDTPIAVSPSVSITKAYQPGSDYIVKLDPSGALAAGDSFKLTIPVMGDSTNPLSVNVSLPQGGTDLIASINNALTNAATAAGVSLDKIPQAVHGSGTSIDFNYTTEPLAAAYGDSAVTGLSSSLPIILERNGLNATTTTFGLGGITTSATAQNKEETINLQSANADATIDVAGISVSISKGMTANQVANKVATALQAAFPGRTIPLPAATDNSGIITMTYADGEGDAPLVQPKYKNKAPATGSAVEAVRGSLDPVLMQGLSITPKGEVMATYSNGATYTTGFLGIASFPNDGGLKDIGGNRFVQTGDSGTPAITAAGAPKAGNVMSGALEQANVDITSELMDMIRAQQVYNGNARVLQTTVDTVTRITDMR